MRATSLAPALTIALALVLTIRPGLAQTPTAQTPSASIAGVVYSTDPTPVPVRDARVMLNSAALTAGRLATTDAAGRFVFRALPTGEYRLETAKPAWLGHAYGASRPGRPGVTLTIAAGQSVADVRLAITRGAVVTGIVRNDRGQPQSNVLIQILQRRFVDGEHRLDPVPGVEVRTDDTGTYRVFGLAAAETFVVARPPQTLAGDVRVMQAGETERVRRAVQQMGMTVGTDAFGRPGLVVAASAPRAYPTVLFPGLPLEGGGGGITLGVGDERTGLDIFVTPVPTSHVSGVVTLPDGSPAQSASVTAVHDLGATGVSHALRRAVTITDAGGEFAFAALPQGLHHLRASVRAPSREEGGEAIEMWAAADVYAAGPATTIALSLTPITRLLGQNVFQGAAVGPPPSVFLRAVEDPLAASIAVEAAPFRPDAAPYSEFVLAVPPGTYQLHAVRGASPWHLVSATLDGRDVLDAPLRVSPGDVPTRLVVTFTDRPTQLSGSLQTASGAPTPGLAIVVFSTDRATWRSRSRFIQAARPSTSGTFDVRGLPAGEYFVAAVTDADDGEWFVPAFLESLVPASVRVILRDGQITTQHLRVSR